jgi:PKD repeat protein
MSNLIKFFFLLLLFKFICIAPSYAQTLTINNSFNSGAYTPGSSIGVLFNINTTGGCIQQTNQFTLYLSDASGSFASPTAIGTATGTYVTYINGIIPANTPIGSNYKVMIKSTAPVVTSTLSTGISIVAGPSVTAGINGVNLNNDPHLFGVCSGAAGIKYNFSDNSSTGSSTANFFNESTQSSSATITLAKSGSFTANATNYTILVTATNGSTIGTQAYSLINNVVINSFAIQHTTTACLGPDGGTLDYLVDTSSPNGIQNNYPGVLYQVTWGDGSTTTYSLCELEAANGNVTHTYTSGSCGRPGNAFQVVMQPVATYCTSLASPLTSSAIILRVPTNSFTFPAAACSNAPVTFTNTSDPGQGKGPTSNCMDPNATYTWSVDGVDTVLNAALSDKFTYTFPAGPHTVTLSLNNAGADECAAASVTQTICIQNPPQPKFTLPTLPVCLSNPVIPTDNSIVDAGCSATNTYLWTVTGPAPVSYGGATSSSSHQPQFIFTQSGTYQVALTISSATCSTISTPQTIVVDAPPSVSLSPDFAVCVNNSPYNFNTTALQTKTTISGTAQPNNSTYTWAVTGNSNFSFVNNTTANSQYPEISFTDFGTYNVSVTVANACGSVTKTQKITFQQSPAVKITPSSTNLCPGSSVSLTGSITPATGTTFTWVGAGVFSTPNSLTTSYTPTAAEIAAKSATISLDVKTGLTGSCSEITQNVTINIFPVNTITSPPAKQICTGSAVNYPITSTVAGSTYSWTAVLTSGNASGFTASGNSSPINDVIINHDPVNNAVVTYTITPIANGCSGTPFNLAITVKPDPILNATPAINTICSGSTGTINLSSNITGTTYTWTSTVQSGTITGNRQQNTATNNNVITDILNNTGNTVGTITYTITPFNGTCAGNAVTVTINIQPLPTPANAGANDEVCSTTSYMLKGNAPIAGTGKWTVSPATTVTFSDATQHNALASGLLPGTTYIFTWTITSSNCQASSSSVTIKDDAAPVGGTTNGITAVCSGSNSGTINLIGELGNIIKWQMSTDNGVTWQDIVNTTAILQYLNLTTTTQYRAVVQNGICAAVNSTVTIITVNPPAVQANAGANDEICNSTSYTLKGNDPAPYTGKWTQTSGPAGVIFANVNQPNTTVSGLIPGNNYLFTWTITPVAPCAPTSAMVTIKDDAAPVGGTTTGSAAVCSGSNSGTITLTGQLGSVIKWEKSIDNGVTWQDIVNTGTALQYNNLTVTTQYRAVVQNGICTAVNSSVTAITVNTMAVQANAGPDDEVCNSTSYTLKGNDPTPYTGKWTVTSGPPGVIFANANQPNTTVSGLIPGNNYQFTWTITPLAPCTLNSNSVTIKDDAAPVGGITTGSTTVCSGSNGGVITLSGEVGSIINWEKSTDNGVTWQNIANTTTSQQYLNLTTTTIYQATIKNGICAAVTSSITTITVNPQPIPANAGSNDEICNMTTYLLKGNNPSPATGKWTLTSGQPGVIFADNTQPGTTVSGLIPGNVYQFTWTITSSPCTSTTASVTIKDDAAPVGGTTNGITAVCSGSNSGTITLTGQLGNIVKWQMSTDNGVTWQDIVNTTATLQYLNLTTTTLYRAVVQNGICATAFSQPTTITVNPPAVQANAGTDAEICNSTSQILNGNDPSPYTGKWTQTAGPAGAVFDSPALPKATVSGLIPGNNYQFTWTITPAAPCAPTSAMVTIKDDAAPIGGTTAGSTAVCSGSNSGTITLTGQLGNIVKWQMSTDRGTTWQDIANTGASQSYNNLTVTTEYLAVVQNGVCATANSQPTTITVNPPAVQANAGADAEICNSTSQILNGNDPLPYTGKWTQTAGPAGAVFDNPALPKATVSGLIPGNNYQFTWTITPAAPCAPSSAMVTIKDDAATAGGTTSSNATVCANDNNGTISLSGQLGNILRWEQSTDQGATWLPITNTTTSQPYLNLTITTQYRAVVQNNNCQIQFSQPTTITVNPLTVQANAGSDQNLCGAVSTTLLANNPSPFTGKWTQTAGPPANILSPDNYQTVINNLIPGSNYTFVWTIQGLAPCADSSSPVQVFTAPDVITSFTADKNNGCGAYTVNFTNTSTLLTGTSFLWNFGDGSASSNAVNPSHTFIPRTDGKDTTYHVSLSIVNNCFQRPPFILDVTVSPQNPIATILPDNLTGCSPFVLTVKNTSPGTNLSYVFYLYNGSTLVQQINKTDKSDAVFNAITTTSTKINELYMVATNSCNNTAESTRVPITISPSSVTAQMFIENNINAGCAPLNVTFTNNSSGGDEFYYTIYSADNHIVGQFTAGKNDFPYTFNDVGTYYVSLTGTDNCSTNESPKTRIDVYPIPQPQFDADVKNGCDNLLVTFTNLTADAPTAPASSLTYLWDFGDNTQSSSLTPPPHYYNHASSNYTVTLTATNTATGCSNTVVKKSFITVNSPPGTEFTAKPDTVITIPNYHFSFVDLTGGNPTSWSWKFGDGGTSTSQNPEHTYADTGLYKVTLTTTSALGCDSTIVHHVRITGTPGQLFLPNAFEPDGLSLELRTFMAKGSGIKEWRMQIFNNYAQLIWETTKLSEKGEPVDGWDGMIKGSPAPQGVYVWQVSATFINGTEWKGNVLKNSLPKRIGVVHLIR